MHGRRLSLSRVLKLSRHCGGVCRPQARDHRGDNEERNAIQKEKGQRAEEAEDDAAQHRPGQPARRHGEHVQRIGRAPLRGRDEVHQAQVEGRHVDRADNAGEKDQRVEQPDAGHEHQQGKPRRENGQREDEQAGAWIAIDQRAGRPLHEQPGQRVDDQHAAHAEGAATEAVGKGNEGDGVEFAADVRPGRGGEETPRVGQRAEIAIAPHARLDGGLQRVLPALQCLFTRCSEIHGVLRGRERTGPMPIPPALGGGIVTSRTPGPVARSVATASRLAAA